MKYLILLLCLCFCVTVNAQEEINEKTELNTTYQLDPFQSILKWKGSYAFQFTEYNGTVEFLKGKLYAEDGKITGGNFIIDMTTITTPEHTKNKEHGPVEHLKNSDFFYVEKYPEAYLELTKVTYYEDINEHRLEGDLTIKDVTKPIMIKAMVDGVKKILKTQFIIDRRDWGINYQSKFKDSAISDAIEFDVTLKFE